MKRPAQAIFGATVFLGAFLLFQVQPILGKYLLPWFGGTPAVWTTCLLFFQVLLLAGYAYGHALAGVRSARAQLGVHGALLAGSVVVLAVMAARWPSPILPGAAWKPAPGGHPTWEIVRLLAVSIGLPFFLLATTAPLVQSWYARTEPERSPYRLYALSNAGSLLGLASYPFVVEPALALGVQGRTWTWAFLTFALGCAVCGVLAVRSHQPQPFGIDQILEQYEPRPTAGTMLLWAALAAGSSVMLLAVTNQICQEVAVVPFLWVLPLSLYLLSFILCFHDERWCGRGWLRALLLAALLAPVLLFFGPYADIRLQIAVFCFTLVACCMVCHGELVRLKPAPRYLTWFYLAIAAGGAAGGVFVALLAPRLFSGYWEFHLGLWGCCLLALVVLVRERHRLFYRQRLRPGFYLYAFGLLLLAGELLSHVAWYKHNTEEVERNFYGVVAVYSDYDAQAHSAVYALRHGRITHGLEYRAPEQRDRPTAYFAPESGIGLLFAADPHGAPLRVGVVGLGIGTLAAYGRPGDQFRFYEINPAVVRLAAASPYFHYLADSRARVEIVAGDGRLSLEREQAAGAPLLDLLVLDAFNSDAPPAHLLTQEAFRLYLARLKPEGVLAVNISNRALDLRPVVLAAAERFGLGVVWVYQAPGDRFHPGSSWMLLARDRARLATPGLARAASPLAGAPPVRPWTDDFSNLYRVLK
ncbi:MAG TPA: fused MFS/spermidine synthase [Terriglobales bacterium]|nr:fused MFS/spermidine synthase [Terriglobales bacterium]